MANNNNNDITGKIGQNYRVKDVPCLIPQENMKQFRELQRNVATTNTFAGFPNPYSIWRSGDNKKK